MSYADTLDGQRESRLEAGTVFRTQVLDAITEMLRSLDEDDRFAVCSTLYPELDLADDYVSKDTLMIRMQDEAELERLKGGTE